MEKEMNADCKRNRHSIRKGNGDEWLEEGGPVSIVYQNLGVKAQHSSGTPCSSPKYELLFLLPQKETERERERD